MDSPPPVMVRVRPFERDAMVSVLYAQLGHATVFGGSTRATRSYSTQEMALINVVRFGQRGYTMAMHEQVARQIAASLQEAGHIAWAHRFAHEWQRARQTRSGTWTVVRDEQV